MKPRFIALLLLAVATTAAADDHISVFISDIAHSESEFGSQWNGGAGIAYSHSWSSRWSSELSVADERRHAPVTTFLAGGFPVTHLERVDTYPVDLMTHYRFANDTRWMPYVGAGLHYIHAPSRYNQGPYGPITLGGTTLSYSDRMSAEVGAGVAFRITPHFGLQFDAKRQLRNKSVPFDPLSRGFVGASWKF
jgi:outer membrane protein W